MYYSVLKHDIERWYLWDEKKEMRIRLFQAIIISIGFMIPLLILIITYFYYIDDIDILRFYAGVIIYLILLPILYRIPISRIKDAKQVNQYYKGSWAIIFKDDELLEKKIINELKETYSKHRKRDKLSVVDEYYIFNSEGIELMVFDTVVIDKVLFKELRILTNKIKDDKLVENIKNRISKIIEKDGQYKT
jgi:hypothetical protein